MNEHAIHYLCLDMGGTGSRGALMDAAGRELARASGPQGALSLGAERSAGVVRHIWGKIAEMRGVQMPEKSRTVLGAGIAGAGFSRRLAHLKRQLSDFRAVHVAGDGYVALLGATDGKAGSLISVGTGVAALRLHRDGTVQSVSGWGFPAGDAGSGAWIGFQAFSDYLKFLDRVETDRPFDPAPLASLLEEIGTDATQVIRWQANAEPAEFGRLAPLVVEGAQRNNPYCRCLMDEAAREIGRVARALSRGVAGEPADDVLHLSGGLGAPLLPYLQQGFGKFNWQLSAGSAVTGAFLLASGKAQHLSLRPRPGLGVKGNREAAQTPGT
ncbi:MAG TPA: hypothetical protein ENJ68_02795 [Devosia sp.]|nr:hypothetical protein [Devosia sp.]